MCERGASIFLVFAANSEPLPVRLPNGYTRRMKQTFDRSVSCPEGCLPIVPVIGRLDQVCEHYHRERNHQGLDNKIIDPDLSPTGWAGEVNSSERLGGLLR